MEHSPWPMSPHTATVKEVLEMSSGSVTKENSLLIKVISESSPHL